MLESSSSTCSWDASEAIFTIRLATDVARGNQVFPVAGTEGSTCSV